MKRNNDIDFGFNLYQDSVTLKECFNTIGLLKVEVTIDSGILIVTIDTKEMLSKIEYEVAKFLQNQFIKYLKENYGQFKYGGRSVKEIISILNERETVVITFAIGHSEETNLKEQWIFADIIKSLYLAVDEAKVEYCFNVKEDSSHDIPYNIFWELDTWNDGCLEDDQEDSCVPPENIRVYKLDKKCLYGMSLGYYDIDIKLVESDIVPELIGVVFDSVEDFCYVTSYEDEENIYIYSAIELNEDNIFEIEEALFSVLHNISLNKPAETLENFYGRYIINE